jgi:hypothetical protein
MTTADQSVRRTRRAHPEEWWSILAALAAAGATTAFLWRAPDFEPSSNLAWLIPGWVALAYIFIQMACLLVSATQIRAIGVVDSIVAIVPVVAGLVTGIEWILGRVPLSPFQVNVLATMLITTGGEFLLTTWARFVLNRRTFGIETSAT